MEDDIISLHSFL